MLEEAELLLATWLVVAELTLAEVITAELATCEVVVVSACAVDVLRIPPAAIANGYVRIIGVNSK